MNFRIVPLVVAVLCWNDVYGGFMSSYEYDDKWNLFVFTQWWPQTQCYLNISSDHGCVTNCEMNKSCVPPGITKWTIHGLWPTLGTEHKPVYCNSSWPFNKTAVEDLKTKMEMQWPSFEAHVDESQFWKHEWEKHGTCCTDLPYLNSEHKYFSETLSLNTKLDIFSALAKSGIVPSDHQTYQVKDVEEALFCVYKVHPNVYCFTPKNSDQMLNYVELCLDKEFTLIDCAETAEHCDFNKPLVYPPIIRVASDLKT